MTTRDRKEGVGLDELLAAATDDDPSPDQLARLDARLAPLLGPPGGGGSPGSDGAGGAGGGAAAAAGGSTLGKWLLAGLTAAGLGAGGYAVVKSRRSPVAPVAHTVTADAAPLARQSAPTDAAPLTPDAAPPPPVKTPHPAPPMPAAEALAAETRLLERAQTGLRDGAPAAALRSVDAHRKRFPKGTLAEERERLAIEALLALDRRPEAEARARRFRKDFPHSVQWQRIRDLLDAAR